MSTLQALVTQLLLKIDQAINTMLNLVLHQASFQQLESSWRNLKHLVNTSARHKQESIKIKLLDYSREDLELEELKNTEFDQTHLYKLIYSQEFDHPGGEPFNIVVGDYYFAPSAEGTNKTLALLRVIGNIMKESHTLFISGFHAECLQFDQMSSTREIFNRQLPLPDTIHYKQWRDYQTETSAQFICLTLPAIKVRAPYHHTLKNNNVFFKETILSNQDHCWGNSNYCLASVIIRSFANTGWFNDIRGFYQDKTNGGCYQPIEAQYFPNENHLLSYENPLNGYLTDAIERQIATWGLVALKYHKFTGYCCFYNCQTLFLQQKDAITSIHQLLGGARFCHYLKIILRDKVGGFSDAESCEYYLNQWLANYCMTTHQNSDIKYSHPLLSAQATVMDIMNNIGHYSCKVKLTLHPQFDNLQPHLKFTTSLRIH